MRLVSAIFLAVLLLSLQAQAQDSYDRAKQAVDDAKALMVVIDPGYKTLFDTVDISIPERGSEHQQSSLFDWWQDVEQKKPRLIISAPIEDATGLYFKMKPAFPPESQPDEKTVITVFYAMTIARQIAPYYFYESGFSADFFTLHKDDKKDDVCGMSHMLARVMRFASLRFLSKASAYYASQQTVPARQIADIMMKAYFDEPSRDEYKAVLNSANPDIKLYMQKVLEGTSVLSVKAQEDCPAPTPLSKLSADVQKRATDGALKIFVP